MKTTGEKLQERLIIKNKAKACYRNLPDHFEGYDTSSFIYGYMEGYSERNQEIMTQEEICVAHNEALAIVKERYQLIIDQHRKEAQKYKSLFKSSGIGFILVTVSILILIAYLRIMA